MPQAPDLNADYEAAGFGARLTFGVRPAVLVVDAVRAYLEPKSPLYAGVEAAVAAMERVVSVARVCGAPVIYTQVSYRPGTAEGGVFRRKVPALACFEIGSLLGEIVPELAPRPDEMVLVKHYASAFFGTSLASSLVSLGVDTVVVVGLSTSGCVRATALDALQHGFIPFVVREACGDRDRRPHEAALFDLQAKYAEVVSEAEICGLFDRTRR